MERTIIQLDAERRRFEQKRNALQRMQTWWVVTASDERLADLRQLMRDYDDRIAELNEEINMKRAKTTN